VGGSEFVAWNADSCWDKDKCDDYSNTRSVREIKNKFLFKRWPHALRLPPGHL